MQVVDVFAVETLNTTEFPAAHETGINETEALPSELVICPTETRPPVIVADVAVKDPPAPLSSILNLPDADPAPVMVVTVA